MPDSATIPASLASELRAAYCLYAALLRGHDSGAGLGGKLIFAGELQTQSLRVVRAANIAGAAVLTASADAVVLRTALRENAIDFQVTSLDEALRILKNEIRKQQPVAVAVHAASAAVAAEMTERGVAADLQAPDEAPLETGVEFLAFAISEAFAQCTPAFDAQLADRLPAGDGLNRRWYRAAPRSFGRAFRNVRSLGCDAETAWKLRAWLAEEGN